ncbi:MULTISPECIES: response regulator [Pseudoalteromonas]|uniref:Histidine kinase n=1 Tax=Pseudoalteromonas amylolytica TaxID=1859457 RepID=A0A1S1MW21_9GAMM|nr:MULTISPECIES: response regulator [Pseudoalteromonas]MCF6434251.1 response regulator [Pseudoalteromonas sp. MMG022]OHU85301.1 histidine kinase [Pseudoalteromonas sp. JW3]OHU93077.1 histidine kinase [Pseudoalteromonas amylolytica]
MARKEVEHVERHPKVVLLCDDVEELGGVTEVISSQITAFRTLSNYDSMQEVLLEAAPLVIIIAMSSVSRSVELYSKLAKQGVLDYPHENILLCENKESGVGFRCCMKSIFRDYFIYKPMYENYRLRMILHNALIRSKEASEVTNISEEHFGRIDDELKQLIDDAAEYHKTAEQTLKDARDNLDQTEGINEVQTALIQELKKQHITPLLDKLETQLSDSVAELTSRLKNKQISVAELSALLTERSIPNTSHHASQLKEARVVTAVKQPSYEESYEDQLEPSPAPEPEVESRPKTSKIMVVEDNEIYREMISKILRDEGHNVESVSSGLTAIKMLRKQKYDLIFMDLFMPELDGYNTTKNIRNIPNCKSIPIIALTSNKNKDLIRKWASLGLAAYIAKPSTKQSILKAVEKCNVHS